MYKNYVTVVMIAYYAMHVVKSLHEARCKADNQNEWLKINQNIQSKITRSCIEIHQTFRLSQRQKSQIYYNQPIGKSMHGERSVYIRSGKILRKPFNIICY